MKVSAAICGLIAFAASIEAAPSKANQAGSDASIKNLKDKIKNVVLITMENRSLDNLLGGQKTKGLDNPVNNGPFCNPIDLADASKGEACSEPNDYDSILNDPDHGVPGNNIEFYGTFLPDNALIQSGKLTPKMNGFVHEQLRLYAAKQDKEVLANQVMNYYTEEQVPVLTSFTKEFVTFNNWHSGHPGPTNPNRAYIVSGTSAGHGTNDAAFGNGELTQKSIFEQLSSQNITWKNYASNAGHGDAGYFKWNVESGNSKTNMKSLDEFYQDAYMGRLPQFTYVNPSCCGVGTNSMHPTGLVSDGEVLLKQMYDAIRNGPQWDNTLFIVTFDETGGFHDHVAPPLAPRPDNLTYTVATPDKKDYTFEFDRLGGRLPTWIISPWVASGYVEKLGVNSDNKTVTYSATSILRTLGYLWDFEPFTPRVEWSPSFDHLIQTNARTKLQSMPNPV
ncbi:hypothetical protein V494_02117 [Pseudogymnoascus sp. VKM F-4513 (FW-928)]|nr:hypothetical protein V494_02117 [Pseudogymnoascus sp. VKM F-4513 (FW-928)]